MRISQTLTKKVGTNKLILGFAAVVASAMIGVTGIAAANANNNNKPSKEQCAAAGYKNYGQCVKEWAHNKPGGGYNGNVHVSADLNLELNNSNNNAIQVIFRPIINIFR